MSATDRLDEIEARQIDPMVTYKENVTEDMPALVAALRAVLALAENPYPEVRNISGRDIRRAITEALA